MTELSPNQTEINLGINPEPSKPGLNLTLTWENINVHSPEKNKGIFSAAVPSKTIIQNVDGIAKPGKLLAIMGASGAGKTTLLNVLTCRSNGNLKMSGFVKLNGQVIRDSSEISSMSGYVQQDDIFIGALKVKEHLYFQAMLRMDSSYTKAEKQSRVEEVLNDLNLSKCQDTLIGDPLLNIKGISGGERRRLAFASEIITNPGILFCDEPTSGLDSFMAMSIVESMKFLATQGRTIVCTIHQPSSEIFRNFDNLYLMAEGRLAYCGPLSSAFNFFTMHGFKCPPRYNPADFYINKLAISPFDREKSLETVKFICDGFETSTFAQDLKKEIADSNQSSRVEIRSDSSSIKTNTFNQLKWLMWRDGLSSIRNPLETKILISQTVVIALMFGLIYLNLKVDQEGIQNINGVIFLLVTNSSFSNMFPVLNSFTPMVPLFLRENKNGMYRVINFYLSKFLIDIPKNVIVPVLFVAIVYWMAALNSDVDKFFIACGAIILASFAAISVAIFIAVVSPTLNIALAIAPSILVPLMIFSGFFLNNDSVPVYFLWAKYVSWLYYSNEIMRKQLFNDLKNFQDSYLACIEFYQVVNQWDNIEHIACAANSTVCIQNGKQVMDIMSVKEDHFNLDFVWIGTIIVGFRILAYLALLRRSYKN